MKRRTLAMAVVLTTILFMGPNTVCGEVGTESFKEISAPEVKSMIENHDAIVIHVLSEIEYTMQHITGSINIPIIKVKTSGKLPKNRETPLVFYCMGKR